MIYTFPDGHRLSLEHYPGRRKPVIVLSDRNGYLGHAVFKDDESKEAFDAFFRRVFTPGEGGEI